DLVQQFCGDAARISKALYDGCCPLVVDLEYFAGAAHNVNAAACSGFISSQGTAEKSGFAGNDSGDAMSAGHTVGVHNPGHHLRVGVNIRRRDVTVRANEV